MVGYGEGFNVFIFSHTLDKGIIPLVCDEIYKQINAKTEPSISYRIECTMLEIYNEKVRDLLNPKNNPTVSSMYVCTDFVGWIRGS
jgi:kinesin family protein 1